MVGENWSYLCGVTQDLEADIIIGILNEESIPAIKQYPDAGGFMKKAYGLTTEVDLYVPTAIRETALQLIRESLETSINMDEMNEEKHNNEAETVRDASASALRQSSYTHLLIIFFLVLILVSVYILN